VGGVQTKLDLGSRGPGGCVVEGVFTMPQWRGRGLAAGLVASVAAQRPESLVCLHVGVANFAARAAYERAGMSEQGRCRLLLLG
jgi:predicted GNAT family acetyltransferase